MTSQIMSSGEVPNGISFFVGKTFLTLPYPYIMTRTGTTVKNHIINIISRKDKMQLKRDTDYAIRILLVMAESITDKEFQELKLKTICEKTEVPRQIAFRLCNVLSAAGFIKKNETDESISYIPERDLPAKNILDVIEAVEGQTNLFAVFDRRTEIYQRYGFMTELIKDAISNELSKITIQFILDWVHKKHITSLRAFLDEYEMKTIGSSDSFPEKCN